MKQFSTTNTEFPNHVDVIGDRRSMKDGNIHGSVTDGKKNKAMMKSHKFHLAWVDNTKHEPSSKISLS